MARRTTRQKCVHSLLTAYQRIKRFQLYRRQRHTGNQPSSDSGMDTDSDALSMTSTSLSMPDLSLSSLSLFSVDSGPDQDNAISTTPDTPMSDSRMSLNMHSSFNDSSHDSLPQLQEPRGPTHLVYNAISAIYSRQYQLDQKFRPVRPPAYLPLILTAYKDNEEFYHLFRQYLRIDPITFDKILVEISSNPLFINQSRHPQMPIDYQLAITLYRFGHYGNAASLQRVADWAGVGKGTVLVATRRVMAAVLQNSFKDQAIRMPTSGEKEEAKQWVERRSKCPPWRDGWCFVDGTLIPLAFRPFWYGQSYYDRKCNYSLNIQVWSILYQVK